MADRIRRITRGIEYRVTTKFDTWTYHTDPGVARGGNEIADFERGQYVNRFVADHGNIDWLELARDTAALDDTWVTITSSNGMGVFVPSPYDPDDM